MAEKSSEKAVRLGPGIVSLYSPCDLATNWCASPLTITALAIEPALMVAAVEMRGCGTPEMRPTGGTDDARIAQSVLALRSDLLAGCPAGPLFGEQLVFGLTNYLIQGYGTATPSQLRVRRGGLGRGRERRLKDYIEANIDEPLHITTLSALVGLSPYHLGRMFKLETGLTLHQYVIARRIAAATRLLDTKMTLTEVAFATGFSSHSHFTVCFAAQIGVTPKAFRAARTRSSRSFTS
jgi:AraC family transcriptional regulator